MGTWTHDDLEAENVPFSFKLPDKQGEELRPAPLVYMKSLWNAIEHNLDACAE